METDAQSVRLPQAEKSENLADAVRDSCLFVGREGSGYQSDLMAKHDSCTRACAQLVSFTSSRAARNTTSSSNFRVLLALYSFSIALQFLMATANTNSHAIQYVS